MKNNFNVIDLFCGCGGSALGLKNAGFNIKLAVDIDEKATTSFKKNFPKAIVIKDDISNISAKELIKQGKIKNPKKLIILGCPPCQGFSTARRRSQRGQDERNYLIVTFARIVKRIKPAAFILENVPGITRGLGKKLFGEMLEILSPYYNLEYGVLEVSNYGVPQNRRRFVAMGVLKPKKILFPPKPTHSKNGEREGLKFYKTVRDAIGDLPPIKAGGIDKNDELHKSASLWEINLERLKHTPTNGGSRTSWPEELVLDCHRNVSGYSDVYGRMSWDKLSPTITAGCAMISKGRFGHPEQNRAISLREAARLQSFPDNFIFNGNFGEIASQIGNAVPPLFAQKMATHLLSFIDGK